MLNIYFSFVKLQVLEQLNVFADEDIDSAAEALDNVCIITPLFASSVYFVFVIVWLYS